MKNLEKISKKLNSNGIKVTSISYSEDEICDDMITLTKGFYIQIGSNYYCLYSKNKKGIYTDFGTFTALKSLIASINQNLV